MPSTPWLLDGLSARLATRLLSAVVDLRHPDVGLQDLRFQNVAVGGRVLGVLLPSQATPADVYIRGNDLVATYDKTAECPLRVQVYWRYDEKASHCAVELQVSVQTDELGIAAPLKARSTIQCAAASRLADAAAGRYIAIDVASDAAYNVSPQDGPGCLLFSLHGGEVSYAEMIHAADFQSDVLSFQAAEHGLRCAEMEHHLFPGSLEKGVILRSRIRGVWMPSAEAESLAAAEYRQFLHTPPPLTA